MDLLKAIPVRPEIAQRKEDTKGFLHAEKAIERPFPVELHDRKTLGHALTRNYMLTCIVAFAGAIP